MPASIFATARPVSAPVGLGVHIADNGDGTFTNPVMPNAHWSDPAVLRATSVVDVTVSPDLRAATATVTTRGDAAQKREAFSWLVANAKGFRYALAQRLRHSKRVPEVTFRKADVGGAVALMRLIDEANEGLDDDVIEGGLDFGLDLDEYDDED